MEKKKVVKEVVQAWNYFCANRPYDFIEKVNWNCSTEHMERKFQEYYDTHGAYGSMIVFFLEIDDVNRQALVDYACDYFNEMKKVQIG